MADVSQRLTLVVFTFLLVQLCRASQLVFDSSPTSIVPLLTPALSMRCSLKDLAQSPSSAIIGRDLSSNIRDDLRYDRSITPDDLVHVTSITVMHNGVDDVASVSLYSPAKVMSNDSNLHVTGQISDIAGERGYIQLTWSYPTRDQNGEFTCEVGGVSMSGHTHTVTQTLEVSASEVSLNDLVSHIHDLQLQSNSQQDVITKLQNENSEIKKMNNDQQVLITSLQSEVVNIKSIVHNLEVKTANRSDELTEMLAKARHIETGYLECGHSDNWPNHDNHTGYDRISTDVTDHFKNPYQNPPIVFFSPVYLDDYTGDVRTRYLLTLKYVDNNSLTVTCQTWQGSNIYYLRVMWLSFAS